jgi:lipopolysaccharide transport system ATP-binding protein
MDFAVEIYNVSKIYEPGIYFKQNLADIITNNKQPTSKKIVALDNVSINIPKGKITAIIGDNGSGKSTLLKIIGGITEPTSGTVRVNGTIASILEVGTGFHPDLSGRENIYFSAEMLGMSSTKVKMLESEIISFSELEEYIDIPVKFYSSGMFMRLAFSVISFLNADIILLDEVFAVGDTAFQKKCERRMKDLISMNKSILLVSHEISNVSQICNFFIRMDKGEIVEMGEQMSVVNNYLTDRLSGASVQARNDAFTNLNSYSISKKNEFSVSVENIKNDFIGRKVDVNILTSNGVPHKIYTTDEFFIDVTYENKGYVPIHPVIIFSYQLGSFSVACNSKFAYEDLNPMFIKKGLTALRCIIPANLLNNGIFGLSLFLVKKNGLDVLFLENILVVKISYDKINFSQYSDNGQIKSPVKPRLIWNKIIK